MLQLAKTWVNTHSVKYNYVSTIKEKTLPIELKNFLSFFLKKRPANNDDD